MATAESGCSQCDADDESKQRPASESYLSSSNGDSLHARPTPGASDGTEPAGFSRTRRTDTVLALRESARESFERQLRAYRRGAGPIVQHLDARARHARRRRGVG